MTTETARPCTDGHPDRLLTVSEVRDRYRVSDSTLRRAVRRGELRAWQLSRNSKLLFRADDVEAWFTRFTVEPDPTPVRAGKLSELLAGSAV